MIGRLFSSKTDLSFTCSISYDLLKIIGVDKQMSKTNPLDQHRNQTQTQRGFGVRSYRWFIGKASE